MNVPSYAVIHKEVGETPLRAVNSYKQIHNISPDVTSCYAGRLDPMARGKLLVLFGDECKRLTRYTGLDKEYEIEVVFDVGSDTHDVLGLPTYTSKTTALGDVREMLRKEVGAHERAYPAFSSKTVNGKPLFLHALEGTLPDLPTHTETIYRIQERARTKLTAPELQERIQFLLNKAPRTTEPSKELGKDFRQDEIREAWNGIFDSLTPRTFSVLSLRVTCASGTYMRSLASRLGEVLGTKALALSISRTKIGKYWHGLWWKQY